MGDRFQTIADVEARPEEAGRLAAEVVAWLVEAGIVAAGTTGCVPGAAPGHPPGPRWFDAVSEPDDFLPEGFPGEGFPGGLPGGLPAEGGFPPGGGGPAAGDGFRANGGAAPAAAGAGGLQVVTARTVFHSGQDGIERAQCPHCGTRVTFGDAAYGDQDHDQDGGAPVLGAPVLGGPDGGADVHDADWGPFSDAIGAWQRGEGVGVLGCPSCGRAVALNEWGWEPVWGFGHLGFTFWNWPELDDAFVAEVARRLGHRVVCPWGKF